MNCQNWLGVKLRIIRTSPRSCLPKRLVRLNERKMQGEIFVVTIQL